MSLYKQPVYGPYCDERALAIDPERRVSMMPNEWFELLGRYPSAYEWKPIPENVEAPQLWKQNAPPGFIEMALQDGDLYVGWTYEDYIIYAAMFGKFETTLIWGTQGNGKSDDMLLGLFWIYKDWDTVLKHIDFSPKQLVTRFKSISRGNRIPGLGYDDVTVHFPSSKFKTDIDMYEAVDSMWAAIRTKCSVVMATAPVINRVPKNIKDNLTFELRLGRNQNQRIYRLFRLPGIGTLDSNLFKAVVETPHIFDMYEVPFSVYREYEDMRLDLTEDAIDKLDQSSGPDDLEEGLISIIDAAGLCGMSAGNLQQMCSRGVVDGVKIKKKLFVYREEILKLAETQTKTRRVRKIDQPL